MTDTKDPPEPGADAAAEAAALEAADHAATEAGFAEVKAELEAVREQVLRALADAENTRKRAEKEVADTRAYAVTAFARDLVSVADNLARALTAVTPDVKSSMGEAGHRLLEGVEITYKELIASLARHKVSLIEPAPGDRFDPHAHQAAAQIPSEHAAGAIAAVIQAGWRIGERTLRPAIVAVSGGAAAGGEEPAPGGHVDIKA